MITTKVYDGGCHCGKVRYKVRLDIPPSSNPDYLGRGTRIYKCNCTTCHKLGMFHARPGDPANDFIVLSPSSPTENLGVYNAFGGSNNWYFCRNCGAQLFGVGAKWVSEELDVGKWAGDVNGDGKTQTVWKTSALNILDPTGKPAHYVSVNSITVEGVDLIDWHDKGYIAYLNGRNRETENMRETVRFRKPHPEGCY
ncbi:unnamed protein product [Periconia digitata]|uniref:CENP-V/GFA domain-containing protein n=1 Tax=Periconia digitata TaxID=1303443 RepID=A0A9W4U2U7_9PLEO|nr:unnamed protein product [Periconia digitata]